MIAPNDENVPVLPAAAPRALYPAAPLAATGSVTSIPADRLYRIAALTVGLFLLATAF